MLVKEFPNLTWLKQQANQQFESKRGWDGKTLPHKGWPNVILNAKTSFTYRDNIKGPLSIFTNLSGESSVLTGRKSMKVKEGFFCISNPGEEYTLAIETKKATETLNVHFGENFVKEAVSTITTPPEFLDPTHKTGDLKLFNRIAPLDAYSKALMNQLKSGLSNLKEEEVLFDLLCWLFREERSVKKMNEKVDVFKTSTREEIIKRLLAASDFVYSNYNTDISLDQLSKTACLSKFHFLRLFKTSFGKTPYQFINTIRIHRSKEMLASTHLEVSEIAKNCGFDTPSTFSRMFHTQTGLYPSQFRSQVK
jgi:AraC family transcriptional regulator